MAVASDDLAPPSRTLLLLETRAIPELAAFVTAYPLLATAPRGDGHPVLVLPGLVTSDRATVPLRTYLAGQGYEAYGWELGRNYGLLPGIERRMVERVEALAALHGRKVSLVGWSLGGIYARQLAKMLPDKVRRVITLGSPFKGTPKATNAWRLYEFTSGHKVDDRDNHMGGLIADPPPVPTTAIYSRTDGICAWQCCVETEGPLTENIEVRGSHCGLGHNPSVAYAVADRLAQPEGTHRPFDRSGWRSIFYPEPWHGA
ncbi:MAG: esterase/lipase family protein [Phreatobacter sp.]